MEEIKSVWNRYRDGKATEKDLALLESWYLHFEDRERIPLSPGQVSSKLEAIGRQLPLKRPVRNLWPRVAVSTAATLTLLLGIYFFNYKSLQSNDDVPGLAHSKIQPGKNVAYLTLSDGRRITLSDRQSGVVVKASGLSYSNGQAVKGSDHLGIAVLTANTPRGGSYQFTLPDGSKIWLNAASTLKFPAVFDKQGARSVELSGEAYFEISKDEKHPFVVKSAGQQVEVLGTHFNINSYPDEQAVLTTLAEGAVRVTTAAGIQKILKPDQQTILKDGQLSLRNMDASYAIAWKNGYFMFNSERLETAMNKIARWYNLTVSYQDNSLKEETLLGTISKFDDIGKVLKMIGRTEVVHFEIKGSNITIKRKKS